MGLSVYKKISYCYGTISLQENILLLWEYQFTSRSSVISKNATDGLRNGTFKPERIPHVRLPATGCTFAKSSDCELIRYVKNRIRYVQREGERERERKRDREKEGETERWYYQSQIMTMTFTYARTFDPSILSE